MRKSDLLMKTDGLPTKALRKQAHCGIRVICNFNQNSASREDW
jgi:hypothetical protein